MRPPLAANWHPALPRVCRRGLTADCTVLSMDAETGLLQQTRPAFGGNLMATIVCPNHRPQMATVRPGIFKAPDFDYGRSGTITQISLADDAKARVEISIPAGGWGAAGFDRRCRAPGSWVGRGIGSKKNLLMRRLADAPGAELGCTRPVVGGGLAGVSPSDWPDRRIGFAQASWSIGVSGRHPASRGIGGAECIIAINEDPDAPIFGAAQYKVVGDAVEVVEELLAQLEARRAPASYASCPLSGLCVACVAGSVKGRVSQRARRAGGGYRLFSAPARGLLIDELKHKADKPHQEVSGLIALHRA